MPDYVPYSEDEYAPDAPGTALHFQRWFQNWEAGFEGAAGATRLRVGALQRLAPGDQIRSRRDGPVNIGSSNTLTVHFFDFAQAGTIRVTFEHTTGTSIRVVRIRNGETTELASFASSASYVQRTTDCPVLPGDRISVVHTAGVGGGAMRNVRFMTNGEDLFPGSMLNLEGNTYA